MTQNKMNDYIEAIEEVTKGMKDRVQVDRSCGTVASVSMGTKEEQAGMMAQNVPNGNRLDVFIVAPDWMLDVIKEDVEKWKTMLDS